MKIHFAVAETRITVRGGKVVIRERFAIYCGAKTGEADTRRRYVTCERCRALLKGGRR